METLSAKHITKSFGACEVIHDISTSFHAGTVSAIVGDNGAGKSTFLKILGGAHRPTRGEVRLGATSLEGYSPLRHREAGIEMVYQDLALSRCHDVATNLYAGRELKTKIGTLDRAAMRSGAESVLASLKINIPNIRVEVGTLSGGQQQAIAIARALLFDPKVLLLDEPTAALAAREVGQVIELILREKARGRTVILVSHRLNDVFAVSDRIIVLKRGAIYSDDPANGLTLAEVVQRIVA